MFSTFSSLIGCCDWQSVLWLAAVRRTLSCGCACSSAPAPVLVFYHLSAWVAPADRGEATPVRVKHRALRPLTFENTTWHERCLRLTSEGPVRFRSQHVREEIQSWLWVSSSVQSCKSAMMSGGYSVSWLAGVSASAGLVSSAPAPGLRDISSGPAGGAARTPLKGPSTQKGLFCYHLCAGNIVIMSSDLMNDQAFTFMHCDIVRGVSIWNRCSYCSYWMVILRQHLHALMLF